MKNQFTSLQPYLEKALIDEEDKKLIRGNLKHNSFVLGGLALLALVFLGIAVGMSFSEDETLKGTPVILTIAFSIGSWGFFGYYFILRRKWNNFLSDGHKLVWNTKLVKVKRTERRASNDSSSKKIYKAFSFREMDYEICEDDIGFEQFQKIEQGVELQFSFTPFLVPYRVDKPGLKSGGFF